jgi:hypothetical protein
LLEPGGKIFIQMSHDRFGEFAEPVRTCGLPVVEERAKRSKGGGPEGIFIVLAAVDPQPRMATT